jgi:hypothetical protein
MYLLSLEEGLQVVAEGYRGDLSFGRQSLEEPGLFLHNVARFQNYNENIIDFTQLPHWGRLRWKSEIDVQFVQKIIPHIDQGPYTFHSAWAVLIFDR